MVWILILPLLGILIYTLNIVTRNNQISAQAKIANMVLEIIKPRTSLKKRFIDPPRTTNPLKASNKFTAKYKTSYHNVNGTEILTAKPQTDNNTHLIYLHGGAYILGKNGLKDHKSLITRLIDASGSKVSFVDYPVAPESKYKHTLSRTNEAYTYLTQEYPLDRFILVGDSAGGGLALSLAQTIAQEDIKNPERLVLFSPWLDLSLENPEIRVDMDMILSKEALLYAAEQYVDSNDFRNPLVSPIYGDFTELPPIMMFFGTLELFYADGVKMQHIAESLNLNIHFRLYEEMPHDWIIFPFPESEQAIQEAIEFINKH